MATELTGWKQYNLMELIYYIILHNELWLDEHNYDVNFIWRTRIDTAQVCLEWVYVKRIKMDTLKTHHYYNWVSLWSKIINLISLGMIIIESLNEWSAERMK